MSLMPSDLVRGDVPLASLPDVFQRFSEKLEDPGAKASDFADILQTDPALTMRVLRIVNSAYYSFSSEITNIAHAITIIGLGDLRELILAVSVAEFFKGLPNELVSMETFWRHSVMTAILAAELQKSPPVQTSESMFTAGLLHDVGSLVIYNKIPEMAKSVIELQERENKPVQELELRVIGFDHAAVGTELMQFWRLPEFLVQTVANHHKSEADGDFVFESQLLSMANEMAHEVLDKKGVSAVDVAESFAANDLKISVGSIETAIDHSLEQLESVLQTITQ